MLLQSPVCDFGAPAPDFTLATPAGVRHSRDSLMGEGGLLVAFICNHCPYVLAVIDRLSTDIAAMQAAGVGVALIMPNDYTRVPADAPSQMIRFAAKYALKAPYLVDEDQAAAHAFGAVCTPDFFGYNAQGQLQYRGRIDDAGPRADPDSRTAELRDAMLAIAATGQGPEQQVATMGCSIKWR